MNQETPIPLSVFVGSYLPYSETFIYDQLTHQKAFEATIYSYAITETAERFPYDKVVGLSGGERELYKTFGRSLTFTKEIKKQNPALVHAHFGTNGVYASHFAKKVGAPLAVTFHGHDVPGLFPENRWTSRYFRYQLFAHKMFDYASLYLPCSIELADIAINQFGIDSSKVEIHKLGIDLDRFQRVERPDRAPKVLMVGRFVEKKGFIYALEAFYKSTKQYPEATLTIVGSGPLREVYDEYIRNNNLESKINFPGTMTSQELQALMGEHDVLMAPSVISANGDRESGLIVLKEAAATGLPTIGTYHGGLPEIIDHEETGFLVPERDSNTLADHLGELIGSYKLRQELGLKARLKMENEYDTIKQNALLESHFKSVI